MKRLLIGAILVCAGAGVTCAALFLPSVPFALTLVPLAAAIVTGQRRWSAAAMACFLLWPVLISAIGLIGTGLEPLMVWPGAVMVLAAGAGMASAVGITCTTVLLLAIPVVPASPLLPLASLSGGSLLWIVFSLTIASCVEYAGPRSSYLRAGLLAIPLTALIGVHLGTGMRAEGAEQTTTVAGQASPLWEERPVPVAITERGRWIQLRDDMPPGATLSLGETIFAAEDREARAFWCHAARRNDLTLFIGVSEPYGAHRRGAVWRLDGETCTDAAPATAYRARLGIPGLTGTWGLMRGPQPASASASANWLICLEAFLPWAWADLMQQGAVDAPVVILSNDSAFGAFAGPMVTLRRKAAAAMGRLAGRPVHHAEAGRTYLIATGAVP